MSAGSLMQVLRQLKGPKTKADKGLLVGIETGDDAAVYKISDTLAVVSTVDFFPPIVDDPYTFGEISAANALSDIYAMGAVPKFATNIVCFPKELPAEVLMEIIKGSTAKLDEAGTLLVGGHSIVDKEIKYGLSVTGFINPKDIVRNVGARAGDVLILTKPIGVGVVTTAIKRGGFSAESARDVFASMKTLNKGASEAMVETGVNAATDITGFGLLGHAFEIASAGNPRGTHSESGSGRVGVVFVIRSNDVRFFESAAGLIKNKENRPGAIKTNMEFLDGCVKMGDRVSEEKKLLLYDPQTSGGLLMSVEKSKAAALIEKLKQKGVDGFVIGEVVEKKDWWTMRVE